MKKRILSIFLLLALVLSLVACGEKAAAAPETGAANAPVSAENETPEAAGPTCTLEIRCDTLLPNLDQLTEGKAALVPADGILYPKTELSFQEGESVFDVFRRTMKAEKIHFEYTDASMYNSVYIEGIGNLYEFDCGPQSGWMYSVNGVYPGLGCSDYKLAEGDAIVFSFTCNMGEDLGAERYDEK